MKTAQQRLADNERRQILLLKKVRIEEARKTQKVGEYVREHMDDVEQSAAFLAWLKTDIDKALFGVALDKKDRSLRGKKPAKQIRPTFQAPHKPEVSVLSATAKALPEEIQAKVSALTKKPEPSPLTGSAGDILRSRLNGQI